MEPFMNNIVTLPPLAPRDMSGLFQAIYSTALFNGGDPLNKTYQYNHIGGGETIPSGPDGDDEMPDIDPDLDDMDDDEIEGDDVEEGYDEIDPETPDEIPDTSNPRTDPSVPREMQF
jgi:hypothetical protein